MKFMKNSMPAVYRPWWLICAGLLAMSCGASAGELDWPVEWAAFGPVPPAGGMRSPGGLPSTDNLPDGRQLAKVPEQLRIAGVDYRQRSVKLSAGAVIDLAEIFAGAKRGTTVYLMAPVKIGQSGEYKIYTGANWWMHWWVDGRPVFNTIPEGNKKSPIFITNHVFAMDLPAGEHVLAVAVIAGGGGFSIAAGGEREVQAALQASAAAPGNFRSVYAQAEKVLQASRGRSRLLAGNAIDFAEIRAVLQAALPLAQSDYERALALLDLADAKLNDLAWNDFGSARADYTFVLESRAPDAQRARAAIGMGQTFLRENDYAPAREYFDRADALSGDAAQRAAAQFARAQSFLQERDYAAALAAYGKLDATNGVPELIMLEARAHAAGIRLLPLVRAEHPRLFFNADTWPAVKARALGRQKETFDKMRQDIHAVALSDITTADWGMHAMQAAFIGRVTGDELVFDKTRKMLRATLDEWMRGRGDNRAYSRIAFAAALDWVWNDLTPAERQGLTRDFLRYTAGIYTGEKLRGHLHKVGYYYLRNMFFYAGLSTLDGDLSDIELAQTVAALGQGFAHNWELWNKQPEFAMDDGGSGAFAVGRLGYEYAETPTPVWIYMQCMQSAWDEQIPAAWAYLGITPHHVLRNILGITPAGFKQFGFSKDWHKRGGTIRADLLFDHLGQFIHFFGKTHPQEAGLARYLRDRLGAEYRPAPGQFPVLQFLLDTEAAPPAGIPAGMPLARNFEGRGKVLMSSGFGSNDTYILLSTGGGQYFGGHHDAGHFSIYRNGFLALDTGSRAHSYAKVPDGATFYFAQTIAHNCVLVRNPARQVKWEGEMLDHTGGQDLGREFARVLAFESRPEYAYAAADLTPTYNTNECRQNIRQFVFLPPQHIVVFDRVTAARKDFVKTWLLHTANEPVIKGRAFSAAQDQGRIFCRTLYPSDAVLEKIGGPGREFWASGRNWGMPVNSPYLKDLMMKSADDVPEFQGRWRIEVRPGDQRETDCFLHLLETAEMEAAAMAAGELEETDDRLTVTFRSGEYEYKVSFNKSGPVAGHVGISDGKTIKVDRDFAMTVMPQSGMALEGRPVWGTEHAAAMALEELERPYLLQELQQNPRAAAAIALGSASAAGGAPAGNPAPAAGLLADLSAPQTQVCRLAAWALGNAGSAAAMSGLGKLLPDGRPGVSASACAALGAIGRSAHGAGAVKMLAGMLAAEPVQLRMRAAINLGAAGSAAAVPALAKALQDDPEPQVRASAAAALGRIKAGESVATLMRALRDPDWRVRRQAAAALADIGAPAIPSLVSALAAPEESVQAMAVDALRGIGAPAFEALAAALASDNPRTRGNAAAALVPPAGGQAALPALARLVSDRDAYVRARAAQALGGFKGSEVATALRQAMQDENPDVRAAAAGACARIANSGSADLLLAALRDEAALVRENSATALGRIGQPAAIDPLIAALKDSDPKVRASAAAALGALKAQAAVPALIAAMADAHHGVGYAANEALCRITGYKVEIPIGWDADTIRQYRKPLWDKWLAGQPAGR